VARAISLRRIEGRDFYRKPRGAKMRSISRKISENIKDALILEAWLSAGGKKTKVLSLKTGNAMKAQG